MSEVEKESVKHSGKKAIELKLQIPQSLYVSSSQCYYEFGFEKLNYVRIWIQA